MAACQHDLTSSCSLTVFPASADGHDIVVATQIAPDPRFVPSWLLCSSASHAGDVRVSANPGEALDLSAHCARQTT